MAARGARRPARSPPGGAAPRRAPRPGRARRRTPRRAASRAAKARRSRLAGRGQLAERGIDGQAPVEGGPCLRELPAASPATASAGFAPGASHGRQSSMSRCMASRCWRTSADQTRSSPSRSGSSPASSAAITASRAWSSSVASRSSRRTMLGPHAVRCPFTVIAASRIVSTHVRSAANRATSCRRTRRSITSSRASSVSSNPSQRAGPTTGVRASSRHACFTARRHPARFPLSTVETYRGNSGARSRVSYQL